jgi:hypothetical protein
MKLNFAKVYDRVSWWFVNHALEVLAFDKVFINMTRTSALVCLSSSSSKSFTIERRMHQGYLLAPRSSKYMS